MSFVPTRCPLDTSRILFLDGFLWISLLDSEAQVPFRIELCSSQLVVLLFPFMLQGGGGGGWIRAISKSELISVASLYRFLKITTREERCRILGTLRGRFKCSLSSDLNNIFNYIFQFSISEDNNVYLSACSYRFSIQKDCITLS